MVSVLSVAGLPIQLASGQCCGHNILATSGGATPLPPNSGKVSWPLGAGCFPGVERDVLAGNSVLTMQK